MSILGKFMESMKMNDSEDDDYFLDDDYNEDENYDPPKKKNIFSKKERDDDYNDEAPASEQKPRFLPKSSSSKVVSMKRGMEVSLLKPTSMEDSRDICDYLLAGKAVVLNMEGIHTEMAQRIIDFTSGATYSMNGNLQKISNFIFIATPESVELSGDFQNLLNASAGNQNVSGLNIRM